MLVRFLCPACHQLLGIAPRKIGAQVNCPKCGATILVPNPEELPSAEPLPPTAVVDIVPPAAATVGRVSDPAPPNPAMPDLAAVESVVNLDIFANLPPGAIGPDLLDDVAVHDRPPGGGAPSHSAREHRAAGDPPLDDGTRIVISRRVIYFQAVLLAAVGLLALAAGYLIGSGTRLHGP